MEQLLACANHPEAVEGLRYCSRCGRVFCPDCLVTIQGNAYCAPCKAEQMLDLASGVNPMALDLAHVGRRLVAIILDGFVISVPMVIIFVIIVAAGAREEAIFGAMMPLLFLPSVIYIVYEGLMLGARGQTLGKMAVHIRVVRVDGAPITPGQAWGRAVMRAILASCLSLFNYLPAFLTKEKTCLHDLVASTRVVNAF
jgi:uncharacterized RDD family membrane protein YckC